jgi:hypothetical protein
MSAWRAIEEAKIANLKQLRLMAPLIEQVPCIGPEIARVIKDRLERLSARRVVRVRLVFPKRSPLQKRQVG